MRLLSTDGARRILTSGILLVSSSSAAPDAGAPTLTAVPLATYGYVPGCCQR